MKPITLLDNEQILLEKLGSFDVLEFRKDREKQREMVDASFLLTNLLLKRKAIPEGRLRYFFNPDYNLGRSKISNKENLERNQNSEEIVYRNSAYLKYLRFFLYGANLPTSLISKLDSIYNDEYYDDDRVEKMVPVFQGYFKQSNILKNDLAKESFKYALDLGMSLMISKRLRDKVMKFR